MGEHGDSSKKDAGKARYDLIPPEALDALAELYGIGAAKYADRGWETGMGWGRIFAAMMRHAWKWWAREKFDKTDGQHHLSSVAWCAFALYTYEMRRLGEDTRPVAPLSPRIEEGLNAIDARTPPCPDLDMEYDHCPISPLAAEKCRSCGAEPFKPCLNDTVPRHLRGKPRKDYDVVTGTRDP